MGGEENRFFEWLLWVERRRLVMMKKVCALEEGKW